MQGKLIYEKKYPSPERINKPNYDVPEASEIPSNDLYFGIRVSEQYTIIPERGSRSEEFISEAIRISELYRMNARIVRHYEKVSVQLSFNLDADTKYVTRLFGMADRISFFKENNDRDIAVNLDFYTHVVVKSGIAIAP